MTAPVEQGADERVHAAVLRVRSWLRGEATATERLTPPAQEERCVVELDVAGRVRHVGEDARTPSPAATEPAVLSGTFSCRRLAALRWVLDRAAAPRSGTPAGATGLTAREIEVLEAVGTGRTRVAAARALGVSARTVDKHLEHVNAKLGTTSLVEALSAFHAGTPARGAPPRW